MALSAASGPAAASELWLGAYKHDVAPFSHEYESGADAQLGWRGQRLEGLRAIGRPAPYLLATGNMSGGTDYVAAGLSWRLGRQPYFRPGIGIAIHDGPLHSFEGRRRTDLGSRLLFEPELAVGWRIAARTSLEASWVHLSHAQIFGRQNPGLNALGLRLVYELR